MEALVSLGLVVGSENAGRGTDSNAARIKSSEAMQKRLGFISYPFTQSKLPFVRVYTILHSSSRIIISWRTL